MTYTWACKVTGKTIEVERPVKDIDKTPTITECVEKGWETKEAESVKTWERLVTGGSYTKTFGQKGRW